MYPIVHFIQYKIQNGIPEVKTSEGKTVDWKGLKQKNVRKYGKCSKSEIKKSRRTSSDNVSTPASDRSRSPSIMSTGDEHDEVLLEDDQAENDASSDIDKVLELVHELKQKDLEEYKKKIDQRNRTKTGKKNENLQDCKFKKSSESVKLVDSIRRSEDKRDLIKNVEFEKEKNTIEPKHFNAGNKVIK